MKPLYRGIFTKPSCKKGIAKPLQPQFRETLHVQRGVQNVSRGLAHTKEFHNASKGFAHREREIYKALGCFMKLYTDGALHIQKGFAKPVGVSYT